MDFEKEHRERYSRAVFMDTEAAVRRLSVGSALRVLGEAVERTRDHDMRTETVTAAIGYLRGYIPKDWPLRQFEDSLHIVNPGARRANLEAAYMAIRRQLEG
jgi:hypothetical protein